MSLDGITAWNAISDPIDAYLQIGTCKIIQLFKFNGIIVIERHMQLIVT